jgi:hypothetical protein
MRRKISNEPGDNKKKPMDPNNPASKPHGTTKDQVSEMEGEGQAQVQELGSGKETTTQTNRRHRR